MSPEERARLAHEARERLARSMLEETSLSPKRKLCPICGADLAKDGTCPGIDRPGFTRRMHGLETFP